MQDFFDCDTAKDVFEKIQNELQQSNEVICEFKLNSKIIDDNMEDELVNTSVSDIHTLEIRSQNAEVLLSETLVTSSNYIINLKEDISGIAKLYLKGDLIQAATKFASLLEACDCLVDVLVHTKADPRLNQVNSHQQEALNLSWEQAQNNFASCLSMVLQSFQSRDFVHLSELLEYELNPALDLWQKYLDTCIEILSLDKSQGSEL